MLCEECPTCGGRGEVKTARTVCYEILRELLREARQFNAREFRVLGSVPVVDIFLDDLSGKTAGVIQNHKEVGRLAIELLAGQLQQNKYGIPTIPTTTYVEGSWFDGRSLPNKT